LSVEDRSVFRCGNESVLLAEDDSTVRTMMSALLGEAGYDVIVAENGEVALKIFWEKKDSLALLILDAIMPGKNGTDVLREATEIKPDISAVVMSGYTSEILVMNGFIQRGVKFILKPINPRQFLNTVREVLDRRAVILRCQAEKYD
jgi:two-component system cell cycle sensor histidine kinase/response regulator CckA